MNDYDNICYSDYLKSPNIHSFALNESNPHEIINIVEIMLAKSSSG